MQQEFDQGNASEWAVMVYIYTNEENRIVLMKKELDSTISDERWKSKSLEATSVLERWKKIEDVTTWQDMKKIWQKNGEKVENDQYVGMYTIYLGSV